MKPVFIGGTGRSGTKILKTVLSCHSQITSLPIELRMIIDPDGVLDLISALSDDWSPYKADVAIHRFRQLAMDCASTSFLSRRAAKLIVDMGGSPWRYNRIGIGNVVGHKYFRAQLEALMPRICRHITRGSWNGSPPFRLRSVIYETESFQREEIAAILAEFIHGIYQAIPDKPDSMCWVEDTPYNILSADSLAGTFPNMHIIHIYRDPRDVLASYRTKHWGGRDVVSIARRLADIYQRWSMLREHLAPAQFTEISLEELAAQPRVRLEEICERIGLQYEETLERIPLDRVNAGRWQKELTDQEAEAISPILRPFIGGLGYR